MLLAVTNPAGCDTARIHGCVPMVVGNQPRNMDPALKEIAMEQPKRIRKRGVAVAAALGPGGTAYAVKGETDCRGAIFASPAEFAGARLTLHADLKLQPEQEKVWPTGRRRFARA